MFATVLHTHWAGRAVRLRHFRNGVELPSILEEPYYSSLNQQMYSYDPVEIDVRVSYHQVTTFLYLEY